MIGRRAVSVATVVQNQRLDGSERSHRLRCPAAHFAELKLSIVSRGPGREYRDSKGFLSDQYREAVLRVTDALDWEQVDSIVAALADLRTRGGRLFILGLGGSAGNASHMTNDVRKLARIEAYAPTDNASEHRN